MRKLLFIFVFVCAVSGLFASNLNHFAPINLRAGQSLDISAENGFEMYTKAELHYREFGETLYQKIELELPVDNQSSNYEVDMPRVDLARGLQYYFVFFTASGSETIPTVNASHLPYYISLKKEKTTRDFVKLSPETNEVSPYEDLLVAISTFTIADMLDTASVLVLVNGVDVTSKASISANMIIYQAPPPTANFSFQIKAKVANNMVSSPQWNMQVSKAPTFKIPFNTSGRVEVSTRTKIIAADDDATDDDDHESRLKLNLNGYQGKFSYSGYLNMSSTESSSKQSVNRYALRFNLPHFSATLGDASPKHGEFSFNNRNVRGIHTKLHFKYFRLLTSYGHSVRAVDGKDIVKNYYDANGQIIDEANAVSYETKATANGTFKRNTFSFRTEVGSQENFIWGLTFTKNKDQLSSLEKDYYLKRKYLMVDGALENSDDAVEAQDNIIFGTDVRLALFKNKLVVGAETAMSFLNHNINSGVLSMEALKEDYGINSDDLPFESEDIEDLIIVNSSMEPFKPSRSNAAIRAYLNVNAFHNYATFSIAQTGASFNSLSSSSIEKDSQTISLADNIFLLKNRLNLNFGMSFNSDNLENQKDTTNKSNSFYTNIVYRPTGIPAVIRSSYSSTAFNNDPDSVYTTDTYTNKFDHVANNMSLGFSYDVNYFAGVPTVMSLDYSHNTSEDKVSQQTDRTKSIVSISARNTYSSLPLVSTIRYSFTADEEASQNEKNSYNSIYLRGDYKFFDEKLTPYLSFQRASYSGDIADQSTNLINLGSVYKIAKRTKFTGSFSYKSYINNDIEAKDYTRTSWNLKLSQNF